MDWMSLKTVVTDATGLERDALHLLTGAGAHIFLVFAFRSWFGAWWPLGLIALAEIGNEYMDLTSDYWGPDLVVQQYWESVKDMGTSLAFPLLFLLLARFASGRFSRPVRVEPAPPSE